MLSFKKKGEVKPQIDLSVEKLSLTNTITIEALVQVLLKNGLIKQEELLEEIKKMNKQTTVLKDELKEDKTKEN